MAKAAMPREAGERRGMPMSNEKSIQWWRVELNANGKITSVRQVEAAETNSKTILYVQAWHEIDARTEGRKAMNAYMREAQGRRRERLIAEGKCPWCGGPTDREAGKRCSDCAERDLGYSERRRDKAAGRPVPKLDKRVAIAARRERENADVARRAVADSSALARLAVLEEVRQAWLSNRTVGAFSAWLNSEIEKASRRKVA